MIARCVFDKYQRRAVVFKSSSIAFWRCMHLVVYIDSPHAITYATKLYQHSKCIHKWNVLLQLSAPVRTVKVIVTKPLTQPSKLSTTTQQTMLAIAAIIFVTSNATLGLTNRYRNVQLSTNVIF